VFFFAEVTELPLPEFFFEDFLEEVPDFFVDFLLAGFFVVLAGFFVASLVLELVPVRRVVVVFDPVWAKPDLPGFFFWACRPFFLFLPVTTTFTVFRDEILLTLDKRAPRNPRRFPKDLKLARNTCVSTGLLAD
jgi:hypothetical protein